MEKWYGSLLLGITVLISLPKITEFDNKDAKYTSNVNQIIENYKSGKFSVFTPSVCMFAHIVPTR